MQATTDDGSIIVRRSAVAELLTAYQAQAEAAQPWESTSFHAAGAIEALQKIQRINETAD
jgi:hypothetical protein